MAVRSLHSVQPLEHRVQQAHTEPRRLRKYRCGYLCFVELAEDNVTGFGSARGADEIASTLFFRPSLRGRVGANGGACPSRVTPGPADSPYKGNAAVLKRQQAERFLHPMANYRDRVEWITAHCNTFGWLCKE